MPFVDKGVRVKVRDVDRRDPVVATKEGLQRMQPLHLELLVPQRLVDRARVQAPAPFARFLLGHWKKDLIETLAALLGRDWLYDLLRKVRGDRRRARLPTLAIPCQADS